MTDALAIETRAVVPATPPQVFRWVSATTRPIVSSAAAWRYGIVRVGNDPHYALLEILTSSTSDTDATDWALALRVEVWSLGAQRADITVSCTHPAALDLYGHIVAALHVAWPEARIVMPVTTAPAQETHVNALLQLLTPERRAEIALQVQTMTPREVTILIALHDGTPVQAVADALNITEKSVRTKESQLRRQWSADIFPYRRGSHTKRPISRH